MGKVIKQREKGQNSS